MSEWTESGANGWRASEHEQRLHALDCAVSILCVRLDVQYVGVINIRKHHTYQMHDDTHTHTHPHSSRVAKWGLITVQAPSSHVRYTDYCTLCVQFSITENCHYITACVSDTHIAPFEQFFVFIGMSAAHQPSIGIPGRRKMCVREDVHTSACGCDPWLQVVWPHLPWKTHWFGCCANSTNKPN